MGKDEYKKKFTLDQSIQQLQAAMHHTEDLQVRRFRIQDKSVAVLYLTTTADVKKVDELQRQLLKYQTLAAHEVLSASTSTESLENVSKVVQGLIQGKSVFLTDGLGSYLMVETSAHHARAIKEPTKEKLIQGTHEGFNEDLLTNLYMIRKMLPFDDLILKHYELGTPARKFAILYRDKAAAHSALKELDSRLSCIPKEAAVTIGTVEEWIEDNAWSLFPQTVKTERSDRVIEHLYKEQLVLMTARSPLAVVLPVGLHEFFHTSDEYTSRWIPGSILRLLRYLAFFLAVLLPGLYVSLASYHLEVIPGDLVVQVKTSLEQIPYPPIVEMLLMSVTIELLIEAGIRMPSGIGQIIGIVGGLVIGDAVVQAGLVSEIMIITIALTTVSSFIVPSYEMSATVRILRIPVTFIAAILGFYGMMLMMLFVLIHLCRLKSLGRPYFSLQYLLKGQYMMGNVIRGHATFEYKGRKR